MTRTINEAGCRHREARFKAAAFVAAAFSVVLRIDGLLPAGAQSMIGSD
jgi:hypothetical protein